MTDPTTNASFDSTRLTKNARIKKTLLETRARHHQQVCKTYELKVDLSHVSKKTDAQLRRLFLEAKWFYNDFLARGNFLAANYKVKNVLVKNKNGALESRTLQYLSSQSRQEIIDRALDNARGLSVLKKLGHKVGKLKFKSRLNSIPLKQYGKTHRLQANRVKVQNINQPLKVMDREQIPNGAELTSANLEKRGEDYFIHLATFQAKVEKHHPLSRVGVDVGVQKQLGAFQWIERRRRGPTN